jgi:extradiol dioxygenase family protein
MQQVGGGLSCCLSHQPAWPLTTGNAAADASCNQVDGDPVPVPHFGAALSVAQFTQLAERVRAAGVTFIIEPHIRFKGQPGEQVGQSILLSPAAVARAAAAAAVL